MIYAFISSSAPRSINAQRKRAYISGLVTSFRRFHPADPPLSGALYGFVYYFHRAQSTIDADNLSKPVWDALRQIAYADDGQIEFRAAGLFNLQSDQFESLDVSRVPDPVLEALLGTLDAPNDHILYVEVGPFDPALFRFGYGG